MEASSDMNARPQAGLHTSAIAVAAGVPMRGRWEALTVSDECSAGEQGHQIVPDASRQLSDCG